MKQPKAEQTDVSTRKNATFFADNLNTYSDKVHQLDTYLNIRSSVNDAIAGMGSLLDIGNGGVFDYDTKLVDRIVALDLFLDALPEDFQCPANVSLKTGSALDIHEPDASYDGVLIVMLLHHLVGRTVSESLLNVRRAVVEAYRVLKPGGRFVIVESCVGRWFFTFEKLVFPIAAPVINAILDHPATLQQQPSVIERLLAEETGQATEVTKIDLGKWVLQFGWKVPSVLTPVTPYRFIVRKP